VELAEFPGVELLEPSAAPGRPARFTTRELLRVEREALQLALAGLDVDAPQAEKETLARTLMQSAPSLTGEQRALVHEAASRPDRVVCVVGAAGAGKTTALRVLAEAYRESAVPVLGAAPSGRAADELASSTGMSSVTLHRLLLDARGEGGLPRGCLLVVDEAGMAETRVLAPVLDLVERAEGKAILLATPTSCPQSAPAASTPPSASVSARSASPRTAVNATSPNGRRSRGCAPATPSPTSPTPPVPDVSSSPTT
jgi:ATP-dependent exoDNAse (exonuclease V) alpha subunit